MRNVDKHYPEILIINSKYDCTSRVQCFQWNYPNWKRESSNFQEGTKSKLSCKDSKYNKKSKQFSSKQFCIYAILKTREENFI